MSPGFNPPAPIVGPCPGGTGATLAGEVPMVTNGVEVPSAGDIEQLAHDSFDCLAKSGAVARYARKANTLVHDLAKKHDGDREKMAEQMRDVEMDKAREESFLYCFILDHLADEIENGGDE